MFVFPADRRIYFPRCNLMAIPAETSRTFLVRSSRNFCNTQTLFLRAVTLFILQNDVSKLYRRVLCYFNIYVQYSLNLTRNCLKSIKLVGT